MRHHTRYIWLVLASALLVTLAASAASAGPMPVPKATGSVGLATPLQYASFNAFDYGTVGDRGTVQYTNFDFPVPGTGVWDVRGTYYLDVTFGGLYRHVMTIDAIVPQSPTNTVFSGTGYYVPDPSYTWTVTGSVNGSLISFDILYTGAAAGYVFHAVGTIAPDGSMSGTATDSAGQAPLTWTVPAGSVHEVFSYSAPVTCAVVSALPATDATFVFTIPAGIPLAGLSVVVKVHDGGTPGTNGDTWSHGLATSTCDGPVGLYPITSGNLVVHN